MPVNWQRARRVALLVLTGVLSCLPGGVRPTELPLPRIAVVIDDMGNSLGSGRSALALPGAVTYAFLPHTPHAVGLAEQAHALGREIMLHLPMQSGRSLPLGPGALRLHMTRDAFRRTLAGSLQSVPHAVGVNNHMGSLLTRHPGAMDWVMQDLRARGLYFIDSRTTSETVAEQLARENAVAVARRDVFLDAEQDEEQIRAQFERLLRLARRRGTALGIGHPYPATLEVLAQELPRLQERGVELVPASRLTKTHLRRKLWHASSSRSPKVAKNLKPSPSSTCCAAPVSKWSSQDSQQDR